MSLSLLDIQYDFPESAKLLTTWSKNYDAEKHNRELYDFFDHVGIKIYIVPKESSWSGEILFHPIIYVNGITYKHTKLEDSYSDRASVENLAFEVAFFILENQLENGI